MTPTELWVETVAYRLLDGKRLLLRLPPRLGKSYLSAKLSNHLGESAVLVDGRSFTESNQSAMRTQLQADLLQRLELHGSAQLIFDSYDHAISKTQGARLQNWLTSFLIDGEHARDTGALFLARSSTHVQKPGAGSPLMSRVTPVDPPAWPETQTTDKVELYFRRWFGDSALLIDQAGHPKVGQASAIADRAERDLSYIRDVQKAASGNLHSGPCDKESLSYEERSAHQGLTSLSGHTQLYDRLASQLLATPESSPTWPDSFRESCNKLASLVAGSQFVIWSDRFMFRDIEELRHLMQEVVAQTGCKFLLLGAREVSQRLVSSAEMARLTTLNDVEARWMTAVDYPDLHDRHLFTGNGGWIMPQVHVVVGRQRVGNAVAAAATAFGVDYPQIWRRSITP